MPDESKPPMRDRGTGVPIARTLEETRLLPNRGKVTPAEPLSVPALAVAAASPSDTTLRAGTRFGEHYEIVRLLGVGGMGAVYRGIDHRRRRDIAIKTISPAHMTSPNALVRFEREVSAAAAVHHPNIVEIYDSGIENGTPFIVMQYVRGEDLATIIPRERLGTERAIDLMLSLCAAVAAVHERTVVHRDLKPENIKVVQEKRGETAMLLDFGVAKVLGSHPFFGANPTITAVNAVVGSAEYMSPEQAAGSSHVDYAADQYAIGVILYRCLTQRLPFEAEHPLALMRKIIDGTFDGPRVHRPEISPKLEQVILRAMSRYPEDRYSSVDKLGEALLSFASARGRRLWMDELTSPNREQHASTQITVPEPNQPKPGAIAGGTLAIPPAIHPDMPRTETLPEAAAQHRSKPRLSSSDVRRATRVKVSAATAVSLLLVAFAFAFIAVPKSRQLPVEVHPGGSSAAVIPRTEVNAPGPAAITNDQAVSHRPDDIDTTDARGHVNSPRPAASTPPAPPAGERRARKRVPPRTHGDAEPRMPLPTETPSHIKLIF
jgi:serine/threonine protein kinase